MTEKKRPTLKALEADLEQEVLAFENSAIKIGQILGELKDSKAWKIEAGYSTFKAYFEDRWEGRIGCSYRTIANYVEGAKAVAEMQEIAPHVGGKSPTST